MYWTERHVFVCTGNHCNQKGASKVVQRLRFELMRRKLNARIMMNTCGTIDLCDIGPNVIVYPDNVVLSNVSENDVPDIIAYLMGGEVPERLVTNAATPAEENRRSFYAEMDANGNALTTDTLQALIQKYNLDEHWIAEQLRRGFMSKKPNEDGEDTYAFTTMTRNRYRLNR